MELTQRYSNWVHSNLDENYHRKISFFIKAVNSSSANRFKYPLLSIYNFNNNRLHKSEYIRKIFNWKFSSRIISRNETENKLACKLR